MFGSCTLPADTISASTSTSGEFKIAITLDRWTVRGSPAQLSVSRNAEGRSAPDSKPTPRSSFEAPRGGKGMSGAQSQSTKPALRDKPAQETGQALPLTAARPPPVQIPESPSVSSLPATASAAMRPLNESRAESPRRASSARGASAPSVSFSIGDGGGGSGRHSAHEVRAGGGESWGSRVRGSRSAPTLDVASVGRAAPHRSEQTPPAQAARVTSSSGSLARHGAPRAGLDAVRRLSSEAAALLEAYYEGSITASPDILPSKAGELFVRQSPRRLQGAQASQEVQSARPAGPPSTAYQGAHAETPRLGPPVTPSAIWTIGRDDPPPFYKGKWDLSVREESSQTRGAVPRHDPSFDGTRRSEARASSLDGDSEVPVGKTAKLLIRACDSRGVPVIAANEPFVASVHGPTACPTEIRDQKDGTYRLNVGTGSISGDFFVTVMLRGQPIRGSPHLFKVLGHKAHPANYEVNGGGGLERATVGQEVSFELIAHDAAGKRMRYGGERLRLHVTRIGRWTQRHDSHWSLVGARERARSKSSGRGGHRQKQLVGRDVASEVLPEDTVDDFEESKTLSSKIVDNRDGSYLASYAVSASGTYRISVHCLKDDKPINGSPWHVVVAPGPPYPPACVLTDSDGELLDSDGGVHSVAGQSVAFEFRSVDVHGNLHFGTGEPWVGSISGPYPSADQTPVGIHDVDGMPGRYAASFTCVRAGEYTLSATLRGGHAKGSPVRIHVSPAEVYPARCKAEGRGLQDGIVGQPASFYLVTRDWYANRTPDAGRHKFSVQIKAPPSVSKLCWQRLQGEPGPAEGRIELSNPALAAALVRSASREFTTEEWAGFQIREELTEKHWIRGKNGNLFEPSVTQPPAPRVRLEPLADGRVGCSFVPRVPGPHLITVQLGKTPIEGSEFVCEVRLEEDEAVL